MKIGATPTGLNVIQSLAAEASSGVSIPVIFVNQFLAVVPTPKKISDFRYRN